LLQIVAQAILGGHTAAEVIRTHKTDMYFVHNERIC
jgi:hypothetical protein